MNAFFLVGVLIPLVWARCSFENDDMSARWYVSDGNVTVEFENRKVTNDQWTGIAFGRDMNDLEVVVVKIQDNKPTLATGFTAGYEAPTLDSAANVAPKLLSFQDGKLTLHFTRPLGETGARNHSLDHCQTWSFVSEGPYTNDQMMVHPSQASMMVCPQNCKKSDEQNSRASEQSEWLAELMNDVQSYG